MNVKSTSRAVVVFRRAEATETLLNKVDQLADGERQRMPPSDCDTHGRER